jgi:hypothetical protein
LHAPSLTLLQALVAAEIISVRHNTSGRPSTIRAGRPVLHEAMRRLVDDGVFSRTQRLLSASAAITSAETAIRTIEAEVHQLAELHALSGGVARSSDGVRGRADFLLKKMAVHQGKVRAGMFDAALHTLTLHRSRRSTSLSRSSRRSSPVWTPAARRPPENTERLAVARTIPVCSL